MKIGIFFNGDPKEGGNYQHAMSMMQKVKKISNEFEVVYLTANKKNLATLKENNCEVVYYKKSIIYRLQSIMYKFYFFTLIFKKLKIKSIFDNIALGNNIDLYLFHDPSEDSLLITTIPFIFTLFELQHRTNNYLPEYYGAHDFDLREKIISNAAKKAFKVIVATNKDKDLLEKFYVAEKNNVIVQPYIPSLPLIYEKLKNKKDIETIYNRLKIEFKDYLFYPAQFWPHKNHRFIIDAVKSYNEGNPKKINVIFSGSDKGNLKYIKKIIKQKNLENYFKFIGFISDAEVIALYKRSKALIMPTYVGHSTLPIYEAFYFKVPVIFTKNLLDEKLKKLVYEIDINTPNELKNIIYDIENDLSLKKEKVNNAKLFYEENCNEDKLIMNFEKIFEEYKYIKLRWKDNQNDTLG